ncbi:MAG: PIN domain-containing protein [Myxococcaceae bacterium]
MRPTLVDTSCWVDFFRGEAAARERVDPLLEAGTAATTGPVFAEVVSGARTQALFDSLAVLLRSLSWLEPGPNAWNRVAELRFLLARQGVQAHLVDLLIAVTAAEHGHRLLTRERDFTRITRVLAVDVTCF